MVVKEYESPCGHLYLASIGSELCLNSWHGLAECYRFIRDDERDSDYKEEWGVLEKAETELEEYFNGERRDFDIPLKIFGTEFQKSVWRVLLTIPYGETMSYRKVAALIGNPAAVRAVANACARNPLAIFIPCHRVTSSSGGYGGYAGGKSVKERLLLLEKHESIINE